MDNNQLKEAIQTASAMSEKLNQIAAYKKSEIEKGNISPKIEKVVNREAELLIQAAQTYNSVINLLVKSLNDTQKAYFKAIEQRTAQSEYIRTIEGEMFSQTNKMERLMQDEELSKLPINLLSRINAYVI